VSVGAAAALPAGLTGADLRKIREASGMSLRHIAAVTKIGLRFLEYVEEDRFAFLPAAVYLRGFLQEYARLVGIDPRRAADAYMSRLPAKG
jgi:cytoskeletal protein RodZ